MTHRLLNTVDRRHRSGLPSLTIMPAAMNSSFEPVRRRVACALLFLAALAPSLSAAPPPGGVPGMPRGQKHESRHEIEQLEEAWRNAMLKSDAAALDALLAEDYMAITPSGTLQSKEEALASLRSGGMHLNSVTLSDRKMRFYGTTALVTSKAEVSGTTTGRDISGAFRYTHVYARNKQGAWKIVSFEANRIREPGEKK
ncbi:MAG: nuclear transport factor 2 family protein [Terracidiphilus sp.]